MVRPLRLVLCPNHFNMPNFSALILEQGIAPGVTKLDSASIPEAHLIADQAEFWVANYFLSSAFRGGFKQPIHAYVYNYMRRARQAFAEHRLARQCTLNFVESGGQSVTKYVDALFHWETFLGQAWHAYQLLATPWKQRVFEPKDGSTAERLNALYNQMKHVESRIENGQILYDATVPVWLETEGLRSVDWFLSFAETGDILMEIAEFANALSDPTTALARLEASDR